MGSDTVKFDKAMVTNSPRLHGFCELTHMLRRGGMEAGIFPVGMHQQAYIFAAIFWKDAFRPKFQWH